MDRTSTVPTQKSLFLTSQIRLLSAVLQPSSTWRDNPTTPPLPPKTLTTVLSALNQHLATHNRAAYPPQTQRHIIEQIDKLYWEHVVSLSSSAGGGAGSELTLIPLDVDLSTPRGLDALPGEYGELFVVRPEEPESRERGRPEDGKGSARRYEMLRERLAGAMAEQRRQRERLEGYRALTGLVGEFDQAGEGVHGGERDGELKRELERLRVLVGRVVGGLEGMDVDRGPAEEKMEGVSERERVKEVMDALL